MRQSLQMYFSIFSCGLTLLSLNRDVEPTFNFKQIGGHCICHAGAIDVVTSRKHKKIHVHIGIANCPASSRLETSQDNLTTKFLMGLDELDNRC